LFQKLNEVKLFVQNKKRTGWWRMDQAFLVAVTGHFTTSNIELRAHYTDVWQHQAFQIHASFVGRSIKGA
jgi:hypothetical protein